MKIIIEVKDTATLDRIEQLNTDLLRLKITTLYSDVIKSISKEW